MIISLIQITIIYPLFGWIVKNVIFIFLLLSINLRKRSNRNFSPILICFCNNLTNIQVISANDSLNIRQCWTRIATLLILITEFGNLKQTLTVKQRLSNLKRPMSTNTTYVLLYIYWSIIPWCKKQLLTIALMPFSFNKYLTCCIFNVPTTVQLMLSDWAVR